jgi:hypothetical protein
MKKLMKKTVKKLLILSCFMLTTCFAFGQDKVFKMTPQDSIVPQVKNEKAPKEIDPVENRRIVGGNLWFNVWGRFTTLEVSPIGAYKLNEKAHVGLGATYSYISGYSPFQGISSDYSVYGGRAFVRYMLFDGVFAHAEYEYLLGLPVILQRGTTFVESREWVGGVLLGGSYRSKLGQQTASVLTVMYNATHNKITTPSASPLVIRVSFEYEF